MTGTATGSTARRSGVRPLAGTGTLIRFILRRDRIRIPLWLLGLAGAQIGTAAAYPDIYPTAADRQAQAQVIGTNPAMVVMTGPGHGLDDYTYGAMMTNEVLGFMAILVALMSVLMVVRHTRAEEESGRAELVRAAVVGRHAHLAAAFLTATATALALGLLVAVGLGGLGVESLDWSGSLLFGAAYAMAGMVFAGVAAVAVQVTEHARAASGLAGLLIGAAYLLRALGDVAASSGESALDALSWLSPIGWAQATRAYVDDTWWPLLLALVVTAGLLVVAVLLSAHRDIGTGLVRPRVGRAVASRSLGTPIGFALRLHRAGVVWWSLAMVVLGLAYGAAMGVVEDYEDNAFMQRMLAESGGAGLAESWSALVVSLLAMLCAVFGVQAAVRPRREEIGLRAEPVLATAVSRTRWVAGHVLVAFAGGVLVLAAAGLGLGVGATASTEDEPILRLLGAALAYTPAVWVPTAVAVALFGVAPRVMPAAWAIVVYAFVVVYFGPILDLPAWMRDLSPYNHVAAMPVEEFRPVPFVVLAALAGGLVLIGLAGFRRRDVGVA